MDSKQSLLNLPVKTENAQCSRNNITTSCLKEWCYSHMPPDGRLVQSLCLHNMVSLFHCACARIFPRVPGHISEACLLYLYIKQLYLCKWHVFIFLFLRSKCETFFPSLPITFPLVCGNLVSSKDFGTKQQGEEGKEMTL